MAGELCLPLFLSAVQRRVWCADSIGGNLKGLRWKGCIVMVPPTASIFRS